LADNWEAKGLLRGDLRPRLFRAAGYVDPRESQPGKSGRIYEPVLDRIDVKAFPKGRDLPDQDAADINEAVELLVDQRLRRLGLD
jgi:hypothetical protein